MAMKRKDLGLRWVEELETKKRQKFSVHSKVTVIFTILELHENKHGVRNKASLGCEKIQDVRATPGSKMLVKGTHRDAGNEKDTRMGKLVPCQRRSCEFRSSE